MKENFQENDQIEEEKKSFKPLEKLRCPIYNVEEL